ncbi:nuclear transport factor 2 family protein [Oculatella sp. LEGE 06141]|uniref:ester cyclase n=1 Tax=Oculatella sp. LEGE 06141 TaxID=1828648 RepID=UPI001881EBDC|nr:ester cyclase [Oculatella sp. LEGE 06141]MBE9180168.1 nuclear transport factor 2 family protein [Oculatella sp. LEGE 06141]
MATNEDIIRELYAAAESKNLDADKFASRFHDEGYFLNEASGERWYGQDVRQPIEALASAFPDMHRELLKMYATDDVVVVELKLQGTHQGDFHIADGVIPATGKTFNVPCCDVFHLKDGKVMSFHCYNVDAALER